MCKIIQFPITKIETAQPQHSKGYDNLARLFEVCGDVETCNFYLGAAEELYSGGHITETEFYTLRRMGRQKRLKLATPAQETKRAEAAGTYVYTPEMGEQKPQGCQMEAGLNYYGGHYWIKTDLELKGRGIREEASARDGRRYYTVTKRAFEKLGKQYAISYESHLD